MTKLEFTDLLANIINEYCAIDDCPIVSVANASEFLVLKLNNDTVWRLTVSD